MKQRRVLTLALTTLAAISGCTTQKPPAPAETTAAASASPATRASMEPDVRPNTEAGIPLNDVQIEQALFGSGARLADVTDRVVQLLRSEPGGFTATADWLHADPVPGKNKSLLIRYRFRGKERFFMVTGGNRASYAALIAIDELGR